jgi:UDP-N-acetylmuramyl pentapeptide phosphotransferase/UDP-N-acetylglucosamine-1-phosphate transferase
MIKFVLMIFSLSIIYLINKFKEAIAKKNKLLDRPDKIRKFHKKRTPLLGGMMIFSSFLLINLHIIFFQSFDNNSFTIFICCSCCLILGLIVLVSFYSVHEQSEIDNHPSTDLRRFILLYCIITSFLLGFIVNLNF